MYKILKTLKNSLKWIKHSSIMIMLLINPFQWWWKPYFHFSITPENHWYNYFELEIAWLFIKVSITFDDGNW